MKTTKEQAYLKAQEFWAQMRTLKAEEVAMMENTREWEKRESQRRKRGSADRSGALPRKTWRRSHWSFLSVETQTKFPVGWNSNKVQDAENRIETITSLGHCGAVGWWSSCISACFFYVIGHLFVFIFTLDSLFFVFFWTFICFHLCSWQPVLWQRLCLFSPLLLTTIRERKYITPPPRGLRTWERNLKLVIEEYLWGQFVQPTIPNMF